MKALNRQRSEDWQFFHTTFLFNNSGKKKKMQRLWVNGSASAKLLCQDPSEKYGRDHPQWCITLPSIMNTSGYHQDRWGCAVLTDSAEPLTSCLWTFSCLFEQDEHFFVAVVLGFSEAKQTPSLFFHPQKNCQPFQFSWVASPAYWITSLHRVAPATAAPPCAYRTTFSFPRAILLLRLL